MICGEKLNFCEENVSNAKLSYFVISIAISSSHQALGKS